MQSFIRFSKYRFINRTGLLCLILALSFIPSGFAQNCNNNIFGTVVDEQQQPLPGVAIELTHASKVIKTLVTDTSGAFSFKELCPDTYQLHLIEMDFQPITKTIVLLDASKSLKIVMKATYNQLDEVHVTADKILPVATAVQTELNEKSLAKNSGDNLGDMLKQIPGVSALQSGPTLSKPAIHGLSGDRVLILNNGVRQEGQQWGDDHGPELDPQTAGTITVVKGAASVRYGSDALSGVVIINPPALPKEPGISGNVNIIGASNGRKGAVSGTLQGAFSHGLKGLAWRLQGTLKRSGNAQTPLYYLDNTGMAEGDFSAALGYQWKKLNLNASFSRYNAKIGIFSGSEADDSAGLLKAFQHRNHPHAPDIFTYQIAKGYQSVNHDIFKLKAKYELNNKGQLSLTLAHQNDLRQEYSPDEGLPEDWFNLLSNSLDMVYKTPFKNGFSGSLGLSAQSKNNQYQGLDLRPLIPNYKGISSGIFAIERFEKGKWLFEAGLRYDYLNRQYQLQTIGGDDYYHDQYQYHNLSGTVGATFTLNNRWFFNANFGTGWRAPGADELFIEGVHSSAAQYVTGDSSLTTERSYNTSISLHYHANKLHFNVDLYDNEINNFIYLNPVGSKVIDGSGYHAYQYVQDNARLIGADLSLTWNVLKHLSYSSKTTLLRATNKTLGGGLINMPPAKFQNSLTLHEDNWGKMQHPYLTIEHISVLKQNYIVPEQMSMLPTPPPAYNLWNMSIGTDFNLGKNTLNLSLAVNNLTNKVYSDYMNQFRYFVYDLGRNIILRAKISF